MQAPRFTRALARIENSVAIQLDPPREFSEISSALLRTTGMPTFKLKFFTGPTCVREIATGMTEAGIKVAIVGTEHVYVEAEGSDELAARWNVLASLMQTHGKDYGLR